MDSTKLLEALLGDDADDLGDRAKKAHTEIYQRLTPRLRPFAAARELLGRLDERGVAVVLATSAPEDELKALLRVLDAGNGSPLSPRPRTPKPPNRRPT